MPPPQNTSPILNGEQMPVSPMSGRGGSPLQPERPKSSIGPVAGAIIVILLLIAGGLYFWGAQLNNQPQPAPYIPSNDTSAPQTDTTPTNDPSAGLPPQSSSDDVSSIQADANAMNTDQLNTQNSAELNNI